jgi:uncharacterized protein YprB with RNaseH-like and TPR domain
MPAMKAYLDIETCAGGQVTVVGIYREDRGLVQLVGGAITDVGVWEALDGVDVLCTFNGERFDLPILERQVRVDLRSRIRSMDLLRECRCRGIKGGLKRLEQRFGIARRTCGMNGWDAVRLWSRYDQERDEDALRLLLDYNREDVMNLIALERIVVGVGLELEDAGRAAPPGRPERQGELFAAERIAREPGEPQPPDGVLAGPTCSGVGERPAADA